MMHSSPQPLTIALDLAKRLHHELVRHLSPEKKRDFARMERLIADAHKQHETELKHHRSSAASEAKGSVEHRRRSLFAR